MFGVSPRDSHEISRTIGGVHKLMISLRDLVKEKIRKIIGEEMGGVRDYFNNYGFHMVCFSLKIGSGPPNYVLGPQTLDSS